VHTGAVGKRFSPSVERRKRLVDRDELLKEAGGVQRRAGVLALHPPISYEYAP